MGRGEVIRAGTRGEGKKVERKVEKKDEETAAKPRLARKASQNNVKS